MNKYLIYISILFVFISCKSGEQIVEGNNSISKNGHPYTEAFHKGVRFKTQGRVDEAINQFNICLTIKDNDPAVYYALSKLHLMKDDYLKSSEYIKKAAELDPENTWYIQELAFMYYETKDFENSVANFKKLVEIEPQNIPWLFGYSDALLQNGETKKSIEVLDLAEDEIGMNPQLSTEKFRLYMTLNDEVNALAELEKCKTRFPESPQLIGTYVEYYFDKNDVPKAVEMLEELVKTDESNGRAYLALADIYRQQRKIGLSIENLKKAIPIMDTEIDPKMNVLLGIYESSSIITEEILSVASLLVDSYPEDAKSWSIKADFLLKMNNEPDALDAYRKAIEFDQTQFPIWNQILVMEYQQGKYDLLYKDSKACLELFPSITSVYLLNGVGSNLTDHHEEAIESLSLGLEFVVNDIPIEAEMNGQLGEAYFGISENQKGIEFYQKAIALDPRSLLLKNNFAFRLAIAKENLELAESLIDQVLESGSEIAQFIDTKGLVHFQKGEYETAKENFEKAYSLDNHDGMVLEHLGDVFIKLNDKSKAITWWKRAQEEGQSSDNLNRKIQDGKYYEAE